MDQSYVGAGTKLEAAQQAILLLNQVVAEQQNGSRVALVTFNGAGNGRGDPPLYPAYIRLVQKFTTNFNRFERRLLSLDASGGTPTGAALEAVAEYLPQAWKPANRPVVILLSDGVPTIDLDEHGFPDRYVQPISLYDNAGNFYTPAQVRNMGQYFPIYNERAGETLADAMLGVQHLKAALPEALVYSVAVQSEAGGIFNADILEYVAVQGDGQAYPATDANALAEALKAILSDSTCSDPPPPSTPTPSPTLTPTPVADNVCTQVSVENLRFHASKHDNLLADVVNESDEKAVIERVVFYWPEMPGYDKARIDWYKLGSKVIWSGNGYDHPQDTTLTSSKSRRTVPSDKTRTWRVDLDKTPKPLYESYDIDHFGLTLYLRVDDALCEVSVGATED
ncbi:MAG: VWA domain-containing protein [Chloroflexi bacterium]|nr:VWA domain-containing protein [Chloroflexota bacterium]